MWYQEQNVQVTFLRTTARLGGRLVVLGRSDQPLITFGKNWVIFLIFFPNLEQMEILFHALSQECVKLDRGEYSKNRSNREIAETLQVPMGSLETVDLRASCSQPSVIY